MPEAKPNPAEARALALIEQIKAEHIHGEPEMFETLMGLQQTTAMQILSVCGGPGQCSGCGRNVFWLRTRQGKNIPYDAQGHSHWATCTVPDRFRDPSRGGDAA